MKYLKILLLLSVVSFSAKGQKIDFFNGKFNDAYKLSRKENKPMFIFAAVDGCDICANVKKQMEDNLVITYYNEHFISYKMDANDMANNIRLTNWGLQHAPAYAYFKKKKKEYMIVSSGFKDASKLLFDAQEAVAKLGEPFVKKKKK